VPIPNGAVSVSPSSTDDVLGRDAQLVGDDLRPGGLVPLALGLGPGAQDRLAGHVDPQLGRVEHLDAEDVVLAAVAGPERLGHRRDADAEQPAPLRASSFSRRKSS
jgi:hypothetical protein